MTEKLSTWDQRVTFVELFFDLIFVFSVTQVVGLIHYDLTWISVGQAVFVFWLVWWAWTQFTWALNPADTTHPVVEVAVLIATAVAFFMAVAVPRAFYEHGLAFALSYVLVRGIGLGLYARVASTDPAQHAAVRRFALASTGGLVAALAGGLMGGTAQYWLWGLTILLDVTAAAVGADAEGWHLRPEHFAERHGLIVIIALGETLIVAAGGAAGEDWTAQLLGVAVLAVIVSCALWWSYFSRAKPELDHAMESARGSAQSRLARDVFSLIHFPMLCGVVAYAVAVGEAVAHPADPLTHAGRLALSVGTLLFVGGTGVALWRATGQVRLPRLALATLMALAVVATPGGPAVSFGVALVGVTAICLVEERSAVRASARGERHGK